MSTYRYLGLDKSGGDRGQGELFFLLFCALTLPLLVDFSSSVANSRSRAFRKSILTQRKVPTNLNEYALGGARTHETDLYQARG